MNSNSPIQYITHPAIDKQKWDACVEKAGNGLIYSCSFYLDNMASHWDALVLNDYEAIMPLTWNRKFGITYLYQPFLTAQLGLFGQNISRDLLESFLHSIPRKFKYWDIYLNYANLFSADRFKLYSRTNYILGLDASYSQLYKGYRENITRNIKKAEQAGCKPVKGFDAEQVIEMAWGQMQRHSAESKQNLHRFRRLYSILEERKQAMTYGIISPAGQLLSSCIFLFFKNRAYYILVGNHPDGRKLGASHALIDAFIKDHAGKPLLLDFEGSDIPSLAFFYNGFGAIEQPFAGIRRNNLPFFLKWLKK